MPLMQVKLDVSGDVNLNIKLSPELEAFLKQLIPEKTEVKTETKVKSKPVAEPEKAVETVEEKPIKKEPEPDRKKPEKPDKDLGWIDGPNGIKVKYRTSDEGKLYIKYFSGVVETTWDRMIKLSNAPSKLRTRAIASVLPNLTRNKETAISLFIGCLETGSIEPPNDYLMDFVQDLPNLTEGVSLN